MTIWLISRHQSTFDWLALQSGYEFISSDTPTSKELAFESSKFGGIFGSLSLDPNVEKTSEALYIGNIKPNDLVIGNLPLHLIELIINSGAQFYTIEIPNQTTLDRSRDLSCKEMVQKQAYLKQYHLFAVSKDESSPIRSTNSKPTNKFQSKPASTLSSYAKFLILTVPFLWLGSVSADEFKANWDTVFNTIIPQFIDPQKSAFQNLQLDFSAIASFVLFFAITAYIFHQRNKIFSVEGPIHSTSKENARPYLVMGVSYKDELNKLEPILNNYPFFNSETKRSLENSTAQQAQLEMIEGLINNGRGTLGSWQMNMRSLRFHLQARQLDGETQYITMITSPQSQKAAKTLAKLMEIYAKLLGVSLQTNTTLPPVEDKDDFISYKNRIYEAMSNFNAPSKKLISLDITSMTKVYSVVAATISMDKDLNFIYFSGDGKPNKYDARIRFFGNDN